MSERTPLYNAEKETLISFDEESPDANIYTFNKQLRKRLALLRGEYPEIFRLLREDSTLGYSEYTAPVGLLVVKFMQPLSEEKRNVFRSAGQKRACEG